MPLSRFLDHPDRSTFFRLLLEADKTPSAPSGAPPDKSDKSDKSDPSDKSGAPGDKGPNYDKTLDAERNARKDAEAKLRELERKNEDAERKRLEETNEYKTLYEKQQADLEKFKAKEKQLAFESETRDAFTESGIPELAAPALAFKAAATSAAMAETAKVLKKTFDDTVEARVTERLKTPQTPKPGTPPGAPSNPMRPALSYPSMQKP